MEELISRQARKVNIGTAVVIVVAHGDTHAVAGAAQPGLVSDVGEGEVSVVVIEPVLELGVVFLQGRHAAAIHEVEIEIAVAVIIEHGDTGHQAFRLPFGGGRTVLGDELDARTSSDVFEGDRCHAGGCRQQGERHAQPKESKSH